MEPFDPNKLIFIHGLEGSSQGDKAVLLRAIFPGMLTPDFPGKLEKRMELLLKLLGKETGWTIIGSSLGGLMAALFACRHPAQVRKLILLAPALMLPEFALHLPDPIDVPTLVIHGTQDTIVPLDETRRLAESVFTNLSFRIVDDDHRLFKTTQALDWCELVS
jgi:pimeloyl-ACP methyl ester carboxylesterase